MTSHEPLPTRLHLDGLVDFTMMYVAHDAFSRDLRTLAVAGEPRAWAADELAVWGVFTTQLHIHHHAEDLALWPPLRDCDLTTDEVATLDAMEIEHAEIDPHLERVEAAVADGDHAARGATLERLSTGLAAHMRHEENAALPMIETRLGAAGWASFTGSFRKTQGIRGAATYFPWLLEGAAPETRKQVLGVLPPPARLLYRLRWEPAYHRAKPSRVLPLPTPITGDQR